MEALLTIDDEYQYNNFFLSREACVQILGEMCAQQKLLMEQEETETEEEAQEAVPKRILNWLLRAKWLRNCLLYTSYHSVSEVLFCISQVRLVKGDMSNQYYRPDMVLTGIFVDCNYSLTNNLVTEHL